MQYMKSILSLCLSLVLALGCVGCTPQSETDTSVNSDPVSSQTTEKDITLDIAYAKYWTWNDLYDYLESPLQSGQLAFDAAAGETLVLYRTDGVTEVEDWNTPLEDGMMAILYEDDNSIIRRFYLRITNTPDVTSAVTSHQEVPSVVSVPNGDPDGSGESSQTQPPVAEKVTITLNGKSNKALKKAVDNFNKQSQTVTVVLTDGQEAITAAGLTQELNTSVCPDVVLMDHSQYRVAAAKGLLTPFNKADQEPFGLTATDNCYGIALGSVVYCYAANQEILYHCGAELPADYAQMLEAARQVQSVLPDTLPLGVTTHAEDAARMGEEFTNLLAACGGLLLTPENDAAAFYSNAGIRTMQHYQSLLQEGLIAKDNAADDFLKGNTAFGLVSCTDYEQVFGKHARQNYAPLPLWFPEDRQTGGIKQTYYYCVPNGENKDKVAAAYAFLTYLLTDTEALTALCKTGGYVPAHPAVRQDKYYQTEAWQILFAEEERGVLPPPLDCMDTLYGYVAEAVLDVLGGDDPEAALARAKTQTENRLARQ